MRSAIGPVREADTTDASQSSYRKGLASGGSFQDECGVLIGVGQDRPVQSSTFISNLVWGAGIACRESAGLVVERLRVRIPAGAAGECSSPALTLCADSLFGARSTPALPQWHVKDPDHSAKSAGSRLHLNTHTPLSQRSQSGLTKHSVGIYQEVSTHNSSRNTATVILAR